MALTAQQIAGLDIASQRKIGGTATATDITNLNYAAGQGYVYKPSTTPITPTTSTPSPVAPTTPINPPAPYVGSDSSKWSVSQSTIPTPTASAPTATVVNNQNIPTPTLNEKAVSVKDTQGNMINVKPSDINKLITDGVLSNGTQSPQAPQIGGNTNTVNRNLSAEQTFVKNWGGKGGRLPTSQEINQGVYGTPTPMFSTPQGITADSLKSSNGIDLSGTTGGTGAGATASSNADTAANQAIKDIQARQDIIKQTQTDTQKQASSLDATINSLLGNEAGKAAYTTQEQKLLMGEGDQNLNTQLTRSKNRIETLQAEKQKVLTDIEGKPITLANIAGQQAQQVAKYNSEILMEAALSNVITNNIADAERQIQEAVDAKYAPTEEALKIAQAQRAAIAGTLTADEKIQSDALDALDKEKEQAILDKKTEDTNIKNIWLQYYKDGGTDANIASKITNAKTLQEAMNIYAQNLPKGTTDYSATYGTGTIGEYNYYVKTEKDAGRTPMSFNDYQTMDANRKKSVNNTYIDTGSGAYDVIKTQLESSKNNPYTTPDGATHQGDGIYANTDVYKRLRSQAKDKTAFDKNYSYLLNPKDPTASSFFTQAELNPTNKANLSPEQLGIINDAKAAIDQVKQRYGDWNAVRSQIIEQEKQQDGFDISPFI